MGVHCGLFSYVAALELPASAPYNHQKLLILAVFAMEAQGGTLRYDFLSGYSGSGLRCMFTAGLWPPMGLAHGTTVFVTAPHSGH